MRVQSYFNYYTMFQEYWEEHDANSGRQGRIATHISSLLNLLQSHLQRHRFAEATPILETLALATDRAPGVVWRGGREVLLHSGDYTHSLQLYRSFFRVRQWRVETLLETSFFIASHGYLDEGYHCLSNQLQVNPFRSHPLCHGYCALYQYLMHSQARNTKTEAADSSVHINLALKHLETVQAIDAQLERDRANLDLFTKLHSELLVEQGKKDEALAVLVQYRRRHPDRINPTRYVCDCLRGNYPEKTEVRVQYLWHLIDLDESCHEVLELIELCLKAGNPDYPRLFTTLAHCLDYPNNTTVTGAWKLFHKLQQLWPAYEECSEWKERLLWWPKLYPDIIKIIQVQKSFN